MMQLYYEESGFGVARLRDEGFYLRMMRLRYRYFGLRMSPSSKLEPVSNVVATLLRMRQLRYR